MIMPLPERDNAMPERDNGGLLRDITGKSVITRGTSTITSVWSNVADDVSRFDKLKAQRRSRGRRSEQSPRRPRYLCPLLRFAVRLHTFLRCGGPLRNTTPDASVQRSFRIGARACDERARTHTGATLPRRRSRHRLPVPDVSSLRRRFSSAKSSRCGPRARAAPALVVGRRRRCFADCPSRASVSGGCSCYSGSTGRVVAAAGRAARLLRGLFTRQARRRG